MRDWFEPYCRAPDAKTDVIPVLSFEDVEEELALFERDLARKPLIIKAMLPAHNEEEGLGPAIESLLAQERQLDEIIIISDNSTDETVQIASSYPVTVLETEGNKFRKSGALNYGWNERCQDADLVVCCDGDTRLPPHAVRDWEQEFLRNPQLGGSSSQPIMTIPERGERRRLLHEGINRTWASDTWEPLRLLWVIWIWLATWRFSCSSSLLGRLQRNEFSRGCQMSLARGWARVVSGTGCAYRNEALMEAARMPRRAGPWTYDSVVEDYHLTYNMRQAGWLAEMSATVWCWTGSMRTIKSLWYQRIKWQAGTCGDLLTFGFNRLNYREWFQQGFLFLTISFWAIWMAINIPIIAAGQWHFSWAWNLTMPIVFGSMELIHVRRQREKDWKDFVLAGLLVYMTIYSVLATTWGIVSWVKVLRAKMGDLWVQQYRAEGMDAEEMQVGVKLG